MNGHSRPIRMVEARYGQFHQCPKLSGSERVPKYRAVINYFRLSFHGRRRR